MSNAAMTAVFRHSKATRGARMVLLAMADEANSDGELTAYKRSYTALAAKCAMDKSSVRSAVARLVELGELEVIRQGNGRTPSDYQIRLPTLGDEPSEGRGNAHPGGGVSHTQGVRNAHPGGGVTPTPSTPYVPGDAPVVPRGAGAETSTHLAESLPMDCGPVPPPMRSLTDPFNAFWQAYPRKDGWNDAVKAWESAIRRQGGIDPAVIIRAAQRYAADPNRDPQYTKEPAKWLRGGHYHDGPLPARSNGATKVQQSVARLATDRAQQGSAADVAQLGLAERRRTAFRPTTRQNRELPT